MSMVARPVNIGVITIDVREWDGDLKGVDFVKEEQMIKLEWS